MASTPPATRVAAAPLQPSSLFHLVGGNAWALVLDYLGTVGNDLLEQDRLTLGEAWALGKLLPGVRLTSMCQVGASGCERLSTDARLRGLRLTCGSRWVQVFKGLKSNKGLRELDIRDSNLRKDHVVCLAKALSGPTGNSCLQEINLSGNNMIRDVGGMAMAGLIKSSATLRVLDLGNCNLNDAVGLAIAAALFGPESACSLQKLCVNRNRFLEATGTRFGEALGANCTLQSLDLSDNRLLGDAASSVIFGSLRSNMKLQVLRMQRVGIAALSMPHLAVAMRENSTLQVLDIRNNRGGLFAPVFEDFKHNVGLRTLRLGCCGLLQTDCSLLARSLLFRPACLFQELSLQRNTKLGDKGTSEIIKACFRPHSVVRKLNLHATFMSLCSGRELASGIRSSTTIEYIDLGFNKMGGRIANPALSLLDQENCFGTIIEAVALNTSLRTLKLENCGLTPSNALSMGAAMQLNVHIRELDLCKNGTLLDEGCAAIITACFKPNSAIRRLNMRKTGMGRQAGLALAAGLPTHQTLEFLDVSFNKAIASTIKGVSSWPSICAGLALSPGLRSIIVGSNQLRQADVSAMGVALVINRSLQRVDISFNGYNPGPVLAKCLAKNSTLRELDVCQNELHKITILAFTKLLGSNSTLSLLRIARVQIMNAKPGKMCPKDEVDMRAELKEVALKASCHFPAY